MVSPTILQSLGSCSRWWTGLYHRDIERIAIESRNILSNINPRSLRSQSKDTIIFTSLLKEPPLLSLCSATTHIPTYFHLHPPLESNANYHLETFSLSPSIFPLSLLHGSFNCFANASETKVWLFEYCIPREGGKKKRRGKKKETTIGIRAVQFACPSHTHDRHLSTRRR